jgi:hypothetical protein
MEWDGMGCEMYCFSDAHGSCVLCVRMCVVSRTTTVAGGVCQDMATCKGTVQSNLCPGLPNNVRCCFTGPAPTRSLSTLVAIPSGINPGMTRAGASAFLAKIGRPGTASPSSFYSLRCALLSCLFCLYRHLVLIRFACDCVLCVIGCPLTASCFDCQCAATNSIIKSVRLPPHLCNILPGLCKLS